MGADAMGTETVGAKVLHEAVGAKAVGGQGHEGLRPWGQRRCVLRPGVKRR